MKAGTAQKISNAILSCTAGFAAFLFSLVAFLFITEFDEKIVAVAGRRRVLPADQLRRLGAAQQRERPRARRASRPLDGGRGGRSGVAGSPGGARRRCPSLPQPSTALFAEVRASIENAHALGMYDPVTSLPNRLHFRSEADKLLGEATGATKCAMLFVDLDRFKMVNDSLGHARGDQLLIMVANRLRVVVNAEFTGNAAEPPVARPPRRRRVHHVLPRDRVAGRNRARRAPRRAGHFRAVRAELAQRRYRRLDRRRHLARPRRRASNR